MIYINDRDIEDIDFAIEDIDFAIEDIDFAIEDIDFALHYLVDLKINLGDTIFRVNSN